MSRCGEKRNISRRRESGPALSSEEDQIHFLFFCLTFFCLVFFTLRLIALAFKERVGM
jgi:hypothetical protein